jgi:hypothetical protein
LEIKKPEIFFSGFFERLAATYSRGSYTTTTIGKTVFDGRVRNGNGSDHSFMATKVLAHGHLEKARRVDENRRRKIVKNRAGIRRIL